jgi:hypothetical protein
MYEIAPSQKFLPEAVNSLPVGLMDGREVKRGDRNTRIKWRLPRLVPCLSIS